LIAVIKTGFIYFINTQHLIMQPQLLPEKGFVGFNDCIMQPTNRCLPDINN